MLAGSVAVGGGVVRWCRAQRRQLVGRPLREVAPLVEQAGFDLCINGVLDLGGDVAAPSRGRVLLLVDATHRVTAVRPVR